MAGETKAGWPTRLGAWIGGGLVALIGAVLLGGGGWLVFKGGSVYYLLAGAAVLATGVLLVQRRFLAGFIYAGTLAATLGWALWEAGFQFWPLLPRLFAPAVLGLFAILVLRAAPKSKRRGQAMGALAASSAVLLGVLGAAVPGTFTWGQAKAPASLMPGAPAPEKTADWRFYGRDPGGARYSPVDQINAQTIKQLKVEWTFRTGEPKRRGNQDQNTPIQAGDLLYVCTPTNVVIALEPETGKEVWRHDPKVKPHFWHRCRGVGYWDGSQPTVALSATAKGTAAAKPAGPEPLCARRILSTTINAQLFALDAATGKRCPGFGQAGMVDLSVGVGEIKRAFYFQTSTPTVIGDRVIIGGWVMDNQELGEPSGAVRAFDVRTGELVWAWDLGDPSITKLPPEGKTYTRGTPNVWSTPAFDPELGLVYLPTGNATPDYWGSHRSARSEQYSSSVVALDAATGRERWKFQTVHHDVWDYDVPSQPMLIDFPLPGGTTAPGLVQLTKRGQIFVLDRRTGRPLTRVVESPVPGGAEPGEWLSTTQPFSVGMPTVGVERLTEKMMWGATPLDQLACRIKFLSLRYEGDFTPPGSPKRPSLQHPGNAGGMNWGSGAYDPRRGLLIVSEVRMPQSVALKPTDKPALSLKRAQDRPPQSAKAIAYDSDNRWFLSPLFAPCLQPPHGTLTAIDVRSRQIVWQVPAGTAEAQAPLGLKSGLKIPIGTLGIGGPITTAGGLTFRAATTDPYLRAYDNSTGKVVWEDRLPVSAAGTPMTFTSPKSGRQFVVLTAGGGGAPGSGESGDYVVAYALPR